MAKKQADRSPALAFITLAWDYALSGIPNSWERYNQAVGEACRLAAETFHWEQGDLEKLVAIRNRRCSILKCLGENGLETLYSLAVGFGNLSFCREYERYVGRDPIIADGVDGRQRQRLCVGSRFVWKGEKVTVTSFREDGRAVACSYRPVGRNENPWPRKILHRYVISAADVKADRAERKRHAGGQVVT